MKLLQRFWLDHPACSTPVGPIRWFKFKVSQIAYRLWSRWEREALHPDYDDDIPF